MNCSEFEIAARNTPWLETATEFACGEAGQAARQRNVSRLSGSLAEPSD